MSQADSVPITTTAEIALTRKGERYAVDHRNPEHVQHLAAPNPTHVSHLHPDALADLRRQAEDEIERLIGILDRMDGDFDLEAGADAEPDVDDEEGDTGIADWGGLHTAWSEESGLGLLFDRSGATIGRDQLARLAGGRP